MDSLLNYETLVHAIAGAAGSIVGMTCFYPLDNLKIRYQMADPALIDKSTLEALIYLLNNEGIESLYRGLRPVLASIGISNFIYFYSFHGLKSCLPKSVETTAQIDLIFSTIAGVINVVCSSPLWVVNNRLKVGNENNFTGLLDGIVHIASTEGVKSLWSGLVPSLVLVSNPVIHFTIYEALKRRVTVKSAYAFFLLGAFSKTIATVLTYPLQLAQTRQRLSADIHSSTAALMLSIIKRHGPSALFQGLETKILQTVLTAAVMFMSYEKIAQFVFKLLLRHKNKKI